MHELSLCKNILDIIKQKTLPAGTRIKKIYLEIGQLLAIDQFALMFSFEVVAQNTIAENAILEFIEIVALAVCDVCGKNILFKQYGDSCPACGSYSLTITQGEELKIKSMEVIYV